MSNALTTSPKVYPASARVRGGSGGSSHLAAPRAANGTSASLGAVGSGVGGMGGAGGPGSFGSSLRSAPTAVNTPHTMADFSSPISPTSQEYLVEELSNQLSKAVKYKEGAENLLQALDSKKVKDAKKGRHEVEKEYNATKITISRLEKQIAAIKAAPKEASVAPIPISTFGRDNAPVGDIVGTASEDTESPTVALTDLLRDLEEAIQMPEYYVGKANQLVLLFKRHPNLKYELNWDTFGRRIQSMLLFSSKEVVAAGYRVVRYAITDLQSLKTIRRLHTDHLVVLSLVSRSNVEREQALKFVRAFLEISGGVSEVSRAVVRAIVAVAEQSDDRLRAIAIETLAEILILDPPLVVSAGGIRVLVQVLSDGPWEIADSLSSVFLYLLDMPETRKYVRAGHDLEVVFAAFTDTYLSKPVDEERLKSSAKVISSMLKSWPGLLCLSMYDLRALRSLVDSLRMPSAGVRDVILELFFDIFRIKSPSWSGTFLAGRRLTTYGRVANLKSENAKSAKLEDKSEANLVDHFTSLLLAVFVEAGLLETLSALVKDMEEPSITRKTTLLLGETLKLSSQLLPSNYSAKIQLLPDLFSSASRFGVENRFAATGAVYQIDSLNKTLYRSLPTSTSQRATIDSDVPGQRQMELKMKLNLMLDDGHFRTLIMETGILTTKTYSKWNWDALNEMIQGPLLNPKRLEEAIKVTKFMKRLLCFYRPFKYRFCEVKNTKPNQRYIKTGCALFHTLLQTMEGVKFLGEHKILRQISECLAQIDPMSGITSPDPVFSASHLTETLSCGYFSMLGTLSKDPKGLAMMERWCMFNMFYHISDRPDRPDLLQLFVANMDFSLDGHPRIILSKALTTGPKNVRLFATNHLKSLISPQNGDTALPKRKMETVEWAIRLLITQLYDPDVEVCETAVKILEEACSSTHSLEYIVKCRPALDHLGEIGAPLLLRFLSTSVGYHYLHELDYINREMDDWFHGRNDSYVLAVEASLARAYLEDTQVGKSTNPANNATLGVVPPHFYRELARTAEGCRLLREKGHFEEFAWFIKHHGMERYDAEIVTKVKGCLWAVGNIGSIPYGAPFLEEANIVESIVKIAETSEVLTLKGTAFFALGLIAKTMQGIEILLEHGWDSTTSTMGETLGFCMPLSLDRLLSIKSWPNARDETSETNRPSASAPVLSEDPVEAKVLQAVADLGNHIKENSSTKELLKLKATHTPTFTSPELYQRVSILLESYRYRLHVRRFVIDLFGRSVIESIIRDIKRNVQSPESTAS